MIRSNNLFAIDMVLVDGVYIESGLPETRRVIASRMFGFEDRINDLKKAAEKYENNRAEKLEKMRRLINELRNAWKK